MLGRVGGRGLVGLWVRAEGGGRGGGRCRCWWGGEGIGGLGWVGWKWMFIEFEEGLFEVYHG